MQLGHVFLCAYKFTSVYSLFCREELHFFGTRLQNNKTSSGSAMTMVSYWTIHDVTRKHKMADHHHFKVNKMIQKINNTIFIHFATLNSWRYSCVWWLQLRGFPVRDKEVLSPNLVTSTAAASPADSPTVSSRLWQMLRQACLPIHMSLVSLVEAEGWKTGLSSIGGISASSEIFSTCLSVSLLWLKNIKANWKARINYQACGSL